MWHTIGSSAQEGQYCALANGCHHWNLRSANQSWVWVGTALTFQISVLHGTNLLLFIEVIKLSLCTSAIYFTNIAVIIGSVACFDFRVTGIPLWDMTLCRWVISSRCCERTLCLYLQGARVVIYEGGIFLLDSWDSNARWCSGIFQKKSVQPHHCDSW